MAEIRDGEEDATEQPEDGGLPCIRPTTGRRFARNLDWNLLRTFHEIVQAEGISQAARATSRKQPALSMALRRLEELLGTRLCRRGRSGFCLTQEGEILAEACEEIFNTVTAIPTSFADATAELRGRVRIQMISNLVDGAIDEALARLHAAHSSVEIFVSVSTWEVVPRSVLRTEADIGIAPAHVRVSPLKYEPLFRETYRPYCGRAHPLFGRSFSDPRKLSPFGFIHTGADEPEQLTRYRMQYRMGRRISGEAERLEEARRLTLLGTGICFLPKGFASADVEAGNLHPLLDTEDVPCSEICVISNPNAPPHPARDVLLRFLRDAS